MSDAELFRSEPETSNMPIVLASVISLALHGLLWTVPPISMSSQKADNNLNVGLVELTPEEVSRLEEFSDPVPPTLPSTNGLPSQSPLGQPSNQTLEQQQELVNQRIVQRQQEVLRKKLQQQEEVLQRNEELLQRQRERLRSQSEQNNKQRPAQTQGQQPESGKQQQQADSKPLPEDDKKPPKPPPQGSEEPDIIQKWLNDNKFWGRIDQEWERAQKDIEAIYNPNKTGTTAFEGTQNLINWLEEKNQALHKRIEFLCQIAAMEINEEIRFLDSICVRSEYTKFGYNPKPFKLKGNKEIVVNFPVIKQLREVNQASIAVFVNPEGKVEGKPLVMISTGYESLNNAVIEDAQKRLFEPTGKDEIYTYSVKIEQIIRPATP